MQRLTDYFDDLVIDKNGLWTQVCRECAANLSFVGLEDIPIDIICGIKGCYRIAYYYFDFNLTHNMKS